MNGILTSVFGNTFAITGELLRMAMPRKDFALLIHRLGGIYKERNSSKVNFLVVGGDGYSRNHFLKIDDENYISGKVIAHDALLDQGSKQQIISEDQFWDEFLPGYTDKQITDLITEQRVADLMEAHPESYQMAESTDTIACCGRYQECSKAHCCVNTLETQMRCQYYQHLKNGEVFFGTESELFDEYRYEELCAIFDEQSPNRQDEIRQLVYLFVYKKRMIEKVLMPILPVYKKLKAKCLLTINNNASDILYDMYNYNDLKKYVPKEAIATYKESHIGLKMNDGYQKAFCADWIAQNLHDTAKSLTRGYAYISLPKRTIECYDELFSKIIPKDFVFTLDNLYDFVSTTNKCLYLKQK